MSENILPTRKERIRTELDMAVLYTKVAFGHLKNTEDIAKGDLGNLNGDFVKFSNTISSMLKGNEGNPGLVQILEEFKAKIEAEESK